MKKRVFVIRVNLPLEVLPVRTIFFHILFSPKYSVLLIKSLIPNKIK